MLRCLLKVFFCFFETGVRSPAEPLTLKDFKLKATLGRGAFGKVTKVKNVKRHNFPYRFSWRKESRQKPSVPSKPLKKRLQYSNMYNVQCTIYNLKLLFVSKSRRRHTGDHWERWHRHHDAWKRSSRPRCSRMQVDQPIYFGFSFFVEIICQECMLWSYFSVAVEKFCPLEKFQIERKIVLMANFTFVMAQLYIFMEICLPFNGKVVHFGIEIVKFGGKFIFLL